MTIPKERILINGLNLKDKFNIDSSNATLFYFIDKSEFNKIIFSILQTKVKLILMERIHLGEFEELVLLTVGILYQNAYAVAITKELKEQTGRSVNVSAVHKSLYRLEKKGMLQSHLGDAESKRGGNANAFLQSLPMAKKPWMSPWSYAQR